MAARQQKSKKRSAASTTETRPEGPPFFLDQSLGDKVVAQALRQQGCRVELLKEHFEIDVLDEEWLPEVGRRGWLILTKDDRIRRRPAEREALMQSGARAFILPSGNMSGEDMASAIANALPKIQRFVTKNPPPFIARISKAGEVWLLDPPRSTRAKKRREK
ncbi:MAG: hypothetical protein OXC18_17940 [Desulfurellaceae bacterium]|nr:hypothetical protein [Desulfurellaceae bacterium]